MLMLLSSAIIDSICEGHLYPLDTYIHEQNQM
jgi:hypothetical protein